MAAAETLTETFLRVWPTLGPGLEEADPSATIKPSLGDGQGNTLDGAPSPAPPSTVSETGSTLGEGGMGRVRRGVQSSMGRHVALKELKTDAAHPAVVRRLLQEAWVTGFLEHPNIVPIYDIAEDESGQPVILMKQIEGLHWGELLDNPDEVHQRFEIQDVQAWHLNVFVQVCNAIHYAHSKGMIHRDLKPENVMIGPYGEVYVLDWGLSVCVDDRHEPWIPQAVDEHHLAGTPRYMAPEMIVADGSLLSIQTDVYLLGGLLHHILVGHAPHQGEGTLDELLVAIPGFEPEFPEGVHDDLAAAATRALSSEPRNRHDSVDDLRLEVQRHLEQRGLIALAEEAREELNELAALLEGPGEARDQVYARLAAARFASEQVRRAWPEHPTLFDAFREGLESVARWELAAGRPEAAQLVVAELAWPPSELVAELDSALDRKRTEAAALVRLRQDRSQRIGVRTRVLVIAIGLGLWVALPLSRLVMPRELTYGILAISSAAMVVVFGGLGVWARDTMMRTALNRKTLAMILVIPFAQSVSDVASWLVGWDAEFAFIVRTLVWAALMLAYSAVVDLRFLPSAGAFMLSALLSFSDPAHSLWAVVGANLGLVVNALAVWGPAWFDAIDARTLDSEETP